MPVYKSQSASKAHRFPALIVKEPSSVNSDSTNFISTDPRALEKFQSFIKLGRLLGRNFYCGFTLQNVSQRNEILVHLGGLSTKLCC